MLQHIGVSCVALLVFACTGGVPGGENDSAGDSNSDDNGNGTVGARPDAGAGPGLGAEPSSGAGGDTGGGDSSGAGGGANPSEGVDCSSPLIAEQPMRRLSDLQYQNALSELFGAALAAELNQDSQFPRTVIESGFRGDVEANTVNTQESQAIEDNAEQIAARILAAPAPYLAQLLPCVDAPANDAQFDSCIDGFIDGFAARAFRRPLSMQERDTLRNLYDTVRGTQSGLESWVAVIQGVVQSPALLYRTERGVGEAIAGLRRLDSYELAARLAFFLTDSPADDTLWAKAESDALADDVEVIVEAERLMSSAGFHGMAARFHEDWLHLYELNPGGKDIAVFPSWNSDVFDALQAETPELVRSQFTAGGTVARLLGSEQLPVNEVTAQLYGVNSTVAGWQQVNTPNRRGLLGQASVMASLAGPRATAPIHRGAFFVRSVLCRSIPPLPGEVDTQGPLADASRLPTARERLEPLSTRADCSGCHRQFNPVGLAFESYDAMGAYRTQENGSDIDPSGSLTIDGQLREFSSPEELIELVAESADAQNCYARQWFRAAHGRRENAADGCALQQLESDVAAAEGDLHALVLAIVQSDAFLNLKDPAQ